MTIQIRRAETADADGVYEVHSRSIREICRSHYSEADIDAWAGRLFPGVHVDAMSSHEFFVAVEANLILGFGQLDIKTGEIEAIYVHPMAVSRGLGSRILGRLEEQALSAGLSSLRLDASLNSVGFYEHAGFRREAETTHVMRSGVEIACVRMSKALGA